MRIRPATSLDLDQVLRVEREAFRGDVEAELVRSLLADPTARPFISLLAEDGGRAAGHVLLTRASLEGDPSAALTLLAPLAVAPEYQGQGIGGALVDGALRAASDAGATAVLVLGHQGYYPRFGFEPALPRGLEAPYPIPAPDSGAWMVAETLPGSLGGLRGRVVVADALMREELWRE